MEKNITGFVFFILFAIVSFYVAWQLQKQQTTTSTYNYSFAIYCFGFVLFILAIITIIGSPPSTPNSISVVDGNKQAIISFEMNNASSYTVTSTPGNITKTSKTSPIIITGLDNGTTYYFTVTASTYFGTSDSSPPSNRIIPTEFPLIPTNIKVIPGNGIATIEFTPNSNSNHATSYLVTSIPDGITASGTSSPIVVYGLTNGKDYQFTIRGVNADGDSAVSAPSHTISPISTPLPPTDVTAIPSNGSASVLFTPSSSALMYTVLASPGDITQTGTSSPILFPNLTNGMEYTFTITASNSSGSSQPSEPSKSVMVNPIPQSPTNIVIIPGFESVSISFTPASYATSYIITYLPGSGVSDNKPVHVPVTSTPIIVSGLKNGTEYNFTIKSVNESGISLPSQPFTSTPVESIPIPLSPTLVSAITNSGSAKIYFAGSANATSYKVISTPGELSASGISSPITIYGLTNGISYSFVVLALNSSGISLPSSSSDSVIPISKPIPPTNIEAIAGNQSASVSFTLSEHATSYCVTSNPSGISAIGTASPITVHGLSNGSSYSFTIIASNDSGSSSPSTISNNVLITENELSPYHVIATPNDESCLVAFSPSAQSLTYTVTSFPDQIVTIGTNSPIIVNGLKNGTSYYFTVTAGEGMGLSPPSLPSSAVLVNPIPIAPTNCFAIPENSCAYVSFTSIPYATFYTATSKPDGITATSTKSPICISGLTNGLSYTFTVIASNLSGSSGDSDQSNAIIPIGIPVLPNDIVVTPGNGFASISFTPSTRSLQTYTVTSSPGNKSATGSESPIIIPGLVNGNRYSFTVMASNVIGSSRPSEPTSFVLINPIPSEPTNVKVTVHNGKGTVSALVSFSEVPYATSYFVASTPGDSRVYGTTSPITVSGLTSGIEYKFSVIAKNDSGESTFSSETIQL